MSHAVRVSPPPIKVDRVFELPRNASASVRKTLTGTAEI